MALITRGDLTALLLRLIDERKDLGILRRVLSSNKDRVKLTWQVQRTSVRTWNEVPRVVARQNELITGSKDTTTYQYIAKEFIRGNNLSAVSIGCGSGTREIFWAKTGCFRHILAMDVSDERIYEAKGKIKGTELENIVEFVSSDVLAYQFLENSYDVVIAEGILHHLSPLEKVFGRIKPSMKPRGLLVINDYVGPDRFQWDRRQIMFCNYLLSFVPDSMRTYRGTTILKENIRRPGTLSMKIYDPSEAVEPSKTIRLVRDNFETVFRRDFGGTILHPLLKDIAHHFLESNSETDSVLDFLFAAEDYLLSAGLIESDFTFIVARKA